MAEELKTNNMAYKMKGSPMLRNFGIGEKESPLKIAPLAALAIKAAIPAIIGAGTSVAISKSKQKEAKRKEDERKRKEALEGAAEGISGEIGGKSRLA